LAPSFELKFGVDWSECRGDSNQSPFAAGTAGVMLWPTTLVDLPGGIDALLGTGCGMCKLDESPAGDAASYAFNMGVDDGCRCPKIHFAASPAQV
jgi:hypothetical protein